jgi:molecular chaperone HscA
MSKISIDLQKGKLKNDEEIVIGIDLGTTFSLVAKVDGEEARILKRDNTSNLMPSVIYFDDSNQVVIGEQAREMIARRPERTIFSIKRLMGKSLKDVNEIKELLSYRIIEREDDELVRVQVGNRYYNPIELSSFILKELKRIAETELGTAISKAVITVPAYFNDAQRQATKDAGKLAGLDVLRIVNEPTAASLAYGIGLSRDEDKTIAVYDLGGGTFDISILHLSQGIFEVLSTSGDTFLGGDDFDRVIMNHWAQKNSELAGLKDFGQVQELRLLAELAKKEVCNHKDFQQIFLDCEITLTLEEFKSLSHILIERTISNCQQALRDANLKVQDIDDIILVGGSTRNPLIKARLHEFFGKTPNDNINPDEAVALGAAIQADILAGNRKDLLLLDVTPLSLGIETLGGLMDTIIPRNSKIPMGAGRQYTTSVDGQTNLRVSVFQGERELVTDNRKLAEFTLKGIPPMPAGLPKIEIQFIIDADGILIVKAKELRSGIEQEIEIKSQYGISEEEMGKMLLESISMAQEDMTERGLREAVNEANLVLKALDKFMVQNPWIPEENIEMLTKLAQQLKRQLAAGDKDSILQSIEELNTYASPFAQKSMDISIRAGVKGKHIDS